MATGREFARLEGHSLQLYRLAVARWLDDAFFALARALEVDFLFECGAFDARTSVRFVSAGNRSAVAIEANPSTYEAATIEARKSGVETVNLGLSDKQGTATFFIPQGAHVTSNASFLRKPGAAYEEMEIPLKTLDDISGTYGLESQSVALWVDVEGLAKPVLEGGKSLLASPRCKLVKVEVETKGHWSGQALADQVDALMQECGLTPVLRDHEFDGQHNVIYVRDSAVSGLDEIIIQQWALLGSVRSPLRSRAWSAARAKAQSAAHRVKLRVMSGDSAPTLLHRAAAAMGSFSSARIIEKRKDRTPS
ncbi:MAG TPA: FkbM family methyltransferase [Allosphingosinicella sp.]